MQNDFLVITGGLGFIGKNFTNYVADRYQKVLIIDKNSAHSDIVFYESLNLQNIDLIESDIGEVDNYRDLLPRKFDLVNFAAESHVDRSFFNSIDFSFSNYISTHKLLEFIRVNDYDPRFLHVSTDEVYGTILDEAANESHNLNPTNPYSVSKAAADLLCQTYAKCYDLNILIVRPNNIYGPYQHFEKLIPASINAAKGKERLIIHGDGSPKRAFLHVKDFSEAIILLLQKKWSDLDYSIFNITSSNEYSVMDVVNMIAEISSTDLKEFASFGKDRPFNDLRYLTECNRLNELGWLEKEDFYENLQDIFNKNQIFKGS